MTNTCCISAPADPRDGLGFLLHDATRRIKRRFEAKGAELGLTSAQWRVLVALLIHGPLPQARLAEALEVEPISVSRILDRMAEGDWLTRVPDPNDRRIRIVEPSAKAHQAFAETRLIAEDVYARALKGLTQEQNETLRFALKTIISNLS